MSDQKPDEATRALAAQVGLTVQPDPIPNESPSMHDLVAVDLQTRKEFGLRKYGTILQANNGRNPLLDAYDEVLDHAVYIKQALVERAEMINLLNLALTLRINSPEDSEEWREFDTRAEELLRPLQEQEQPVYGTKSHEMLEKYTKIDKKADEEDVWDFGPQ